MYIFIVDYLKIYLQLIDYNEFLSDVWNLINWLIIRTVAGLRSAGVCLTYLDLVSWELFSLNRWCYIDYSYRVRALGHKDGVGNNVLGLTYHCQLPLKSHVEKLESVLPCKWMQQFLGLVSYRQKLLVISEDDKLRVWAEQFVYMLVFVCLCFAICTSPWCLSLPLWMWPVLTLRPLSDLFGS